MLWLLCYAGHYAMADAYAMADVQVHMLSTAGNHER